MRILVFALYLSILHGCGSSGTTNEVDLMGTWNLTDTIQNSPCDGLETRGIVTFNSLNGDTTVIGYTITQGEAFEIDNSGNCIIISIYDTSSRFLGQPSTQSYEDYLYYFNRAAIYSTIEASRRIETYSSTNITEIFEYTNGEIRTRILTR